MVAPASKTRRADSPKVKDELDIPVVFGNLGVGEDTARLGLKVNRAKCTIKQAENYLCGARCEIKIKVDPNADNDTPGQTTFDGIEGEALESVVDIKRYSAGPKGFTAGMTFNMAEIDVSQLAKFAGHSGRLVACRVGDAGIDDDESDEHGSDDPAFDKGTDA